MSTSWCRLWQWLGQFPLELMPHKSLSNFTMMAFTMSLPAVQSSELIIKRIAVHIQSKLIEQKHEATICRVPAWKNHVSLIRKINILQAGPRSASSAHPSPTVVRFLVWTVALTPMGTYFRSRRFRKMHLENILPSPFWARSPGSSWSPWPSGGTLEGI